MSGLRPQDVAKGLYLQLLHPGYAAGEADPDVTKQKKEANPLGAKRVGLCNSYGLWEHGVLATWGE
jgi:hypothetical protein